jgi:hypothetical protein
MSTSPAPPPVGGNGPKPGPPPVPSSPPPSEPAVKTLIGKASAWAKSQGGWAHAIAGVWAGGVLAYSAVPTFHQLVIDVWAHTPPSVRELGLAVSGVVALYLKTKKGNNDNAS